MEMSAQDARILFEKSPDGICLIDERGAIVEWNRGCEEILGLTRAEVLGQPIWDVLYRLMVDESKSPAAYERLKARTIELLSEGEAPPPPAACVYPIQRPDGERRFVEETIRRIMTDRGPRACGFLHDVTARRRAEEALQASEERYGLLVDKIHEGLVILDENALLTFVNASLCTMTGWVSDDLSGQPSAKLFPGEQQQDLSWLARRRAGFSGTYEAVLRRKDGGKVPVLVSASPILDRQGNYKGSIAVLTDITERVEVEESLRRRVEELAVLNRIAHRMSATTELPTALAQASEMVADLFSARYADIIWSEGEKAGFHVQVGTEPGSGQAGPTRLDLSLDDLPVVGPVLREARSEIIADVRSLPRSDLVVELLVQREVQCAMLIPLVIRGTTVGLLSVASDQPGRPFTAHEMNLAETIATDLAAAIEGARLSRRAQAAAVAEERSRLARDLHDAATQTIYSATLIAEVLPEVWARNPAEGQRNLVKLRQLVRGALAEMRTLLFELRPWALEAVELSRLLEYLGNALTGRTRIPVEWDIRGEYELSVETKTALYRIAQEAFNNIAKHARPTQVRVTLRREADQGILSIEDDGCGFDPDSVGGDTMGLHIMRERAEAIGATLTIESTPGCGTTVAVVWPADDGR